MRKVNRRPPDGTARTGRIDTASPESPRDAAPQEPEPEEEPSRAAGLGRGLIKVLAILGAIIVVLAVVQILAALLGSVILPPPPGPSRASRINVQASDLGAGWTLQSSGEAAGFPAGNSSVVRYGRTGSYGGTVVIESRVFVFGSPAQANESFARNVSAIPAGALVGNVTAGDSAVLYHAVDPGFFPARGAYDVILFRRGDVLANVSVGVNGTWEDLSGRPFSSSLTLQADLGILARIVASRV